MRFSWTGLILAPLLAPLIFSALFLVFAPGNNSAFGFLILFVPSCFISYGTTIFLFLPSLFLLSLWRPLTGWQVCLLGLALGAVVFLPLTLMEWKASGPDSGPPTENFLPFLIRWAADPLNALYPVSGLVTAGLYWGLGTWRRNSRMPNSISSP